MKIQIFSLLCLLSAPLQADVSVASLFQDHVVLQQGANVPVWGKSDPGDVVTVSFRDQKVSATAGADGHWRADLKPMKYSIEPVDLIVAGKTTVTIHDVLVGEVWLCSGQSNMEFPLASAQDGPTAVQAANLPLIRQFKVQRAGLDQPAETVEGHWTVCSPATASGFTAVGFFFARELFEKLGVPVGIVESAVSGAQIEPWISEETLNSNAALAPVVERRATAQAAFPAANIKYQAAVATWEKARDAAQAAGTPFSTQKPDLPMGPGNINYPVAFYNGMIHPLIPYSLRGVLWYQGESNMGRVDEYRELLPALITQWRKDWGQGDFPFYIVQLPLYGPNLASLARFREAQAHALDLPNTGMAVTLDIGDALNLHPKNKHDVGLRLARIAEVKLYGMTGTDFTGPVYRSGEKAGNGWRVTFDHADGLQVHGDSVVGFQIAGADNQFHDATAVIEPAGTVLVSAPDVADPAAVRYGWGSAGANLYNAAGLPAQPFRTDAK